MPFFQGIFPDAGIEPWSPTLRVDSLPAEPPGKLRWYYPGYIHFCHILNRQELLPPVYGGGRNGFGEVAWLALSSVASGEASTPRGVRAILTPRLPLTAS